MLSEYRRALHQIPETDWELPKTAAYLKNVLEPLPCAVFSPVGDAVCAYFDYGQPETTAFRSDMDALPVTEETALPFASTHAGKMHACGHDGHMAILLGLAQRLGRERVRRERNVLLIFEPAEETTGGAASICASGVLEKYNVTRIFGLHLWPELPKGCVASRAGAMMARSCELTAEIRGRSTHLAKWREGHDALFAACEFLRGAYRIAGDRPCLLRFGRMHSGEARNSVSAYSRLEGSLRCFDDDLFAALWEALQALAAEIGTKSGCELLLSHSEGYPPVCNDAALLAQARARLAEISLQEAAQTYITEDFSVYQAHVPGVFFLLGTGGTQPLHAPRFDFDEAVLEVGLKLFYELL